MDLDAFLDRLDGVQRQPSGIGALCPSHDDRVRSLSVAEGEHGGVVFHCHAGCEPNSILSALHLTWADVNGQPRVVAEYHYQDHDGRTLYTVERWHPKDFRCRPFLPPPASRVPFNLPWLDYARATNQPVFIVEGEKDVQTLHEHGLIGSTCVTGAGSWMPHYADEFHDLDVTVIADNDEPGLRHAREVYQSVRKVARSTYLARPLFGNDATDLLRGGFPITHVEPVPEDAELEAILASAVRQSKVRWAWERYIPMGTVTIIEGDPSEGKSTLTCDLVARWTTMQPMPDGSEHPGPWKALMVSAEDDPAVTIAPRLSAAGANLDRVVLVTGGSVAERPFNLGYDIPAMEAMIRRFDIRVVVLDPLMAFMPDRVNGLVDSEVRKMLYPIKRMAERLDVAVIVVRHLVKSGSKAMYAGSGSIGIVGAARAAFLVKTDPTTPEQHVLAPIKANLTRKPTALGYTLDDDLARGVARVQWVGPVQWDTEELFQGNAEDKRERDQAADWLESILDNSFSTWKEIVAKGRAEGFSERTLRRARDGIAKHVTNPVMIGEAFASSGTYWYRDGQWPFASLSDTGSAVWPTAQTSDTGQTADVVTPSSEPQQPEDDEDRLVALHATGADRSCAICGATPALPFEKPWWQWRCVHHDPRST